MAPREREREREPNSAHLLTYNTNRQCGHIGAIQWRRTEETRVGSTAEAPAVREDWGDSATDRELLESGQAISELVQGPLRATLGAAEGRKRGASGHETKGTPWRHVDQSIVAALSLGKGASSSRAAEQTSK